MSVERGASELDRTRRQIELFERELRRTGCGDGWRHNGRQRGNAANAAIRADFAVGLIGRRCLLVGNVAVANNAGSAVSRSCYSLGRAKAGDQTRKRDRDERDNALPQWVLRERPAHDRVSTSND
jgi:hypothetical protein